MRQLEYSLESKDGTRPSVGPVILQSAFDDEETRITAIQLLKKDHPEASLDDYDLHVLWTELAAPPTP